MTACGGEGTGDERRAGGFGVPCFTGSASESESRAVASRRRALRRLGWRAHPHEAAAVNVKTVATWAAPRCGGAACAGIRHAAVFSAGLGMHARQRRLHRVRRLVCVASAGTWSAVGIAAAEVDTLSLGSNSRWSCRP